MNGEEQATTRKAGRPKKAEKEPFSGFPRSVVQEYGYFRVPTIMMEVIAVIDNLAELKVVMYVMRHTWGYQEYDRPKHITVDEFVHGRKRHDESLIDSGTGLSDRAVQEGLARALEHGWLVCHTDESQPRRIKKYYALHMLEEDISPSDQQETGVNNIHPSVSDISGSDAVEVNNIHPSTEEESGLGVNVIRSRGECYSPPKDRINLEQTLDSDEFELSIHQEKAEKEVRCVPGQKRERVPAFIKTLLEDFSRDLGDHEHIGSNISQAYRLYQASGCDPSAFAEALYTARKAARKASVKKVNAQGWPNRMPYFFKCLASQLASQAEVT